MNRRRGLSKYRCLRYPNEASYIQKCSSGRQDASHVYLMGERCAAQSCPELEAFLGKCDPLRVLPFRCCCLERPRVRQVSYKLGTQRGSHSDGTCVLHSPMPSATTAVVPSGRPSALAARSIRALAVAKDCLRMSTTSALPLPCLHHRCSFKSMRSTDDITSMSEVIL